MSRRAFIGSFFLLAAQVFVGVPVTVEPLLPMPPTLTAAQAYVGVPLRCKTALD